MLSPLEGRWILRARTLSQMVLFRQRPSWPPCATHLRFARRCLNDSRKSLRESRERITLDFERSDAAPDTILRLSDVLKRTGLSRATIYNRIAKNEFPHQITLGERAVGWLNSEVESWINRRILLRPGPPPEMLVSESREGDAIPNCTGAPDLAQLRLVSTKIYFDKSNGSFWLKLLTEI